MVTGTSCLCLLILVSLVVYLALNWSITLKWLFPVSASSAAGGVLGLCAMVYSLLKTSIERV